MEEEVGHLGPEALGLEAAELGEILRRESRRLHSMLRDQRVIAGIGRAWANEILHAAKLSPYALSTDLSDEEVERLAAAMNAELARGLELRERGAGDPATYRVHRRLGEPCHVRNALAQVDFEEHTIFYCPSCQTGGRVLKDRRPPGCCDNPRVDTVANLMVKDVLTVDPSDTIGGGGKMNAANVGAVVVVEDFVRIVGIVTERDLMRAVAARPGGRGASSPVDDGRSGHDRTGDDDRRGGADHVREQLPPPAGREGRQAARNRQPPAPLALGLRPQDGVRLTLRLGSLP